MSLLKSIAAGLGGGTMGLANAGLLGKVSGLLGSKEQPGGITTTANSPWEAQQPYLTYGFEQARNLYDKNQSLVPMFSQDTQNALSMQRNRAMNGSPTMQNAQNSLNGTINGDYLYGGQGFNAAVDAASRHVLPQINSQFALAGRSGSGLAATAQTQALSDAFASQYGQERNNQMQAIGMAPSFASQDYADIAALRDAGQSQDQFNQQRANEPYQKLQMYQQGIGGNYGGQSVTQGPATYSNPLSGALGGALAGGQLFGPWGAGAGGLLGLLAAR